MLDCEAEIYKYVRKNFRNTERANECCGVVESGKAFEEGRWVGGERGLHKRYSRAVFIRSPEARL